jgi:hypothetical protein
VQLQVYYAALLQVNTAVSIQVNNVVQKPVFGAKLQKSMASVQTTSSKLTKVKALKKSERDAQQHHECAGWRSLENPLS